MAITAGKGMPCLPASVTKPERRLCAPKFPSNPAKRARRLTMVATEPGSRAGPTRSFQIRRNIAPSRIPAASSQAVSASALRPRIGLSGVESVIPPPVS